ncbi:ABC transporter ATP-binding protein [Gramella lutea]|uniref:ABC transporter ATP-binding protein n=1 Tax=Christiangramia lutea TaxID=1607951 RepID=A0A9X2A910_9FLAO|nr:ABC transporter ATP-binding protein [Christiangramia lutea]MCH4821591.1 ABC transporter ATP-binding protein [Christiangramia lutea]
METKNEILVEVEGLSKKFCKDLRTSLWYGVQDLFKGWKTGGESGQLRDKEFWALKDINFKLRRGECLGLIGHNGAGKSTLLKILNGLINPDEGKVTMRGKVGALIELGAGFNPILTGRENIYNNGAVLGFSRKEINEKIEEIIDFAEIREFIDMPVQNYSSGMRVRLGFAVAAQMEPDILIIDEVLAVGDLGFMLKCYKAIDEMLPNTAILFVSHSMPLVTRICNKILLLDHGIEKFFGENIGEGIDIYYKSFLNNEESKIVDEGILEILDAKFIDAGVNKADNIQVHWMGSISIYFKLLFKVKNTELPLLRLIFYDKEQRPIAIIEENLEMKNLTLKDDILEFEVVHEQIQFSKGIYSIDIAIFKAFSNTPIYRLNNALNFQVKHEVDVWPPFILKANFNEYIIKKTNE